LTLASVRHHCVGLDSTGKLKRSQRWNRKKRSQKSASNSKQGCQHADHRIVPKKSSFGQCLPACPLVGAGTIQCWECSDTTAREGDQKERYQLLHQGWAVMSICFFTSSMTEFISSANLRQKGGWGREDQKHQVPPHSEAKR